MLAFAQSWNIISFPCIVRCPFSATSHLRCKAEKRTCGSHKLFWKGGKGRATFSHPLPQTSHKLALAHSFIQFYLLGKKPPRKYYSNNSINFNSSADYHINFMTTLFRWRPYFAFYVHLRRRHWGSPSIVNDLCKAIIKMEVK